MYTENACRASKDGEITPDNLEPIPKNPIIASFFNQIGNADELGSGTKNLFKYTRYYSGEYPQLIERDIFKIIVPLDDIYALDFVLRDSVGDSVRDKVGDKVGDTSIKRLNDNQQLILQYLKESPKLSATAIGKKIGISSRKVEVNIKKLKEQGFLMRIGNPRTGYWKVIE